MADASSFYRISQTVRAVTCRQCGERLDLGDLRVDTLRSGQVRASHHAECFVRIYSAVRIPEDLEGWSLLPSDLQRIVLGFKGDSGLTTSQPTQSSSSQSLSTRRCPQTSSTPVRRTQSSQTTQHTQSSQPVSVIVSRSNSRSSNSSIPLSNSQQLNNSPQSQLSRHTSSTSSIIDLTDINSDGDDYYDSYDDDDDDDEESLPSQDPKRPRLATDSQGHPVMPDLLAGVTIPPGPARSGDECSVCLEPPLHPVTLPCGHMFCFLCAKGLTRQGGVRGSCSLCRQDIPDNFLDNSQVISGALDDVDSQELAPSTSGQQQQTWSWFYEGRNGWWRFEERCNEDLETTYLSGEQSLETIICGQLYVIDFVRMEQYQKNYPTRKRKIKRDLKTSDSKGIAGLQASKRKTMSQGTQ